MSYPKKSVLAAAVLAGLSMTSARADNVIINASGMSFVTASNNAKGIAYAQPGDKIVWRQMMMGGHNTASYEGLIPEGADDWKSSIGKNQFVVEVPEPGLYLYKCTPHELTGMIGAIIVGEGKPANLDKVIESELMQSGPRKRFLKKVLMPELEEKGWAG